MTRQQIAAIITLFSGTILAQTNLDLIAEHPSGKLYATQGKRVLVVKGTPEQMGQAHGALLKELIPNVTPRTMAVVASTYAATKGDWFYDRIEEIIKRSSPHTPKRFIQELNAIAQASGVEEKHIQQANFFPELFHCSGFAARNSATLDGKILHARVLDYMADIFLQKYTVLQVFIPEGYNAWMSVGYASFVGTVTAMNEHGLAIGEMGGGGEGDWDGIPMTWMLRDIMERAKTVREALEIIKSTPRTCEYYYVISDKSRDMLALYCTPTKVETLEAGQQDSRLPPVPKEMVMISGGDRAKELSKRLHQHEGKLTPQLMIEIIKRPVAMKSNLHNAVFSPETLDMWFADASLKKPACDMKYVHVNLKSIIDQYNAK